MLVDETELFDKVYVFDQIVGGSVSGCYFESYLFHGGEPGDCYPMNGTKISSGGDGPREISNYSQTEIIHESEDASGSKIEAPPDRKVIETYYKIKETLRQQRRLAGQN